VADMELWPENREAWEAYNWVKDITLSQESHLAAAGNGMTFKIVTRPGLRPPPLDIGGVIKTLGWLGLDPGPEGGREDLMNKILTIHAARQKADLAARPDESNE